MDAYPGEILAGVFPLVFAVNAILPTAQENNDSATSEMTSNVNSNVDANKTDTADESTSHYSALSDRRLFDRFLDAMAACLAEENSSETTAPQKSDARVPMFLSSGDASSSSDDEDSIASGGSSRKPRRSFGLTSPRVTHTRLGVLKGSARSNQVNTPLSTAYARALQLMDGPQGFFQRARIISISPRHGFPPSKDPEGNKNKAALVTQQIESTAPDLSRPQNMSPPVPIVDGILSAGWLEKHVHALPSVIIVVARFDTVSPEYQKRQDDHVCETIKQLRYSLASKRDCRIQLTCLARKDVSVLDKDEWISDIAKVSGLSSSCVTLLDSHVDLQCGDSPGIPISPPTRKLHKTIRDASLAYYTGQARRNKRKHGMLGVERRPALLPLAVRYCFKMGIFYEFLLRHEKSTKYLAQGYSHLDYYYRTYVLSNRAPQSLFRAQVEPCSEASTKSQTASIGEAGVEVTLDVGATSEATSVTDDNVGTMGETPLHQMPFSDMASQCRAMADWLNLKLLQAGFLSAAFSSSENGGLVAAASQWRRHCVVFLSETDKANPSWNHWAYVSQQRLVMAQLVERRPPRESSLASNLPDVARGEVLMRCSAWKNFQAAAFAMLRLGYEARKTEDDLQGENATAEPRRDKSMRPPFVGGFDSVGLNRKFNEECQRNHQELALEMALHAVSLFENEGKKECWEEVSEYEKDANAPDSEGARLYSMVGGTLIGLKRHEEAIRYLEKAMRLATRWRGLGLIIHQMLNDCFTVCPKKFIGLTTNEFAMESFFNSRMSQSEARQAVDIFASSLGASAVKWRHEYVTESGAYVPFSFFVTFPERTHSTAGDVVAGNVTLKSHLNVLVRVTSLSLLSAAGHIPVVVGGLPLENDDRSTLDDVTIGPREAISLSVKIQLPGSIDSIVSVDVGEKESPSTGKVSSAKSARPRAAGLTSAGGARLIDERELDEDRRDRNGQWSLRYLGGKPLRFDGISISFYPLFAHEQSVAVISAIKHLNLTLLQKKATSLAPRKKTPFEEENYISSAWSRPGHLPLSFGPRCLRVLGPMDKMIVTNLTDPVTKGTAVEGTVNRIILQLQAGPQEECRDIKYKVSCSSTTIAVDGTSAPLATDTGRTPTTEKEASSQNPVLVSKGCNMAQLSSNYDLPDGWTIVGSGQTLDADGTPELTSLGFSESTYIYIDLYKPPTPLLPFDRANDLCQTDFEVAITYKQARPSDARAATDEETDLVVLEHSGSVLWTPPLSSEFSGLGDLQRAFPSGSSHPSNFQFVKEDSNFTASSAVSEENRASLESSELALIHGESVNIRCTLKANDGHGVLGTQVLKAVFEQDDKREQDKNSECQLRLVSECKDSEIFHHRMDDVGSKLSLGSKLVLAYAVEATILNQDVRYLSGRLGAISVEWKPVPLLLTVDVNETSAIQKPHGPLILEQVSTIKFRGPRFCMERAPFEASLCSLLDTPHLATPFEIKYCISNKTAYEQKVTVSLNETSHNGMSKIASENLVLSGMVSGEISLSAYETQTLSYTVISTGAGPVEVPPITVSTWRYKTRVINDRPDNIRQVLVLP